MKLGRIILLLGALMFIMAFFAGFALGGVLPVVNSANQTKAVVETLQYNATRGDCIRDIQGDREQQFQSGISAILNASDRVTAHAIALRMSKQPNYADVVTATCPPAIQPKKGTP